MATSTVILGIDPGLADTGWGIIMQTGQKLTYVAHGCIKTHSSLPLPERLSLLFTQLQAIIQQYRPSICAIEQLFFSKNVSSALPVAHARGVVLLVAQLAQCNIYHFTPNTIKQAIAGSGLADKETVQRMMQIHLRLSEIPKPNHAADALGCAVCYAHGGQPCLTV